MELTIIGGIVALGALGVRLARIKARQNRMGRESLRDKTAVVTGGSRGLGLVIARRLAQRGCKVAICARNAREVSVAVQDLEQYGHEIFGAVCDVSRRDQVTEFLEEIGRRYGEIDILVCNAGVIEVGPVSAMAHEDFESCMDIMYYGVLNPILAVLPSMRRRGSGRIVNIASIGGVVSVPHLLAYSAAKFAAVGLSEGLTAELAKDGIKVTTVVPGLMRTGSYLRAFFKGDHAKEALWFSLSDNIPGLTVSAETAANQIIDAIEKGKPRLTISVPAKLLSLFHGMFPSMTVSILEAVNSFVLPHKDIGAAGSKSGIDVKHDVSPHPLSFVFDLGNKDAEKYLQLGESATK